MTQGKKVTALLLSLLLACLMVACSGADSGTPSTPASSPEPASTPASTGGEPTADASSVSIAISENMTELDPLNQATLPGKAVMHMLFDTLLDSDHEGNYMPALAESWEVSDDGLEWTFKLREDVTFHNGEKFDSADVVCTYQRLLDNKETLIYATQYWGQLAAVEAIDDYNVKLTMSEPSSAIPMSLACTFILPDEAFAEHGEKLFTDQLMYGTGPWVFGEWLDGQYVQLSRNNDYWDKGHISSFETAYVRFITEPATAVNAHVAGTVNAYINTGGVDSDLLPLYAGTEDRIELIPKNCGTIGYLGLQCAGAFEDIKVRQALEYAIDRQAIVDSIFGGGSLPNGMITDKAVGYDASLPNYEYDPEKAKAALEESSYNGEEIVLSSNTGTLKSETVLLAISGMLNEVGFNTTVSIVESATLLEMRSTGEYDAFMVNWSHNFGDPYMFQNQRVMMDVHHTNLVNPEINKLIEDSNVEMDAEKRNGMIQEVNRLMREQSGPYFPILEMQSTFAIDKAVAGLDTFTDGTYDFRYVTGN